MTEPVIVEQLKKTYFDDSRGEVRAVQGINFSCAVGEIFGLLGANGAGKTTTLRMLATIMKPTSGTARIMGYHVVDDALQETTPWVLFSHNGTLSATHRTGNNRVFHADK
jgi:ABC-type multidrug transport system ATPase subunit